VRKATGLLQKADELLDSGLLAQARNVSDWNGGAQWMKIALETLRNTDIPESPHDFRTLGVWKYGLAMLAGIFGCVAGFRLGCLLNPTSTALALLLATFLGALAFYLVEVQFVFLFPLAIDGRLHPMRASIAMTRRMGTQRAVVTVIPIAFRMLSGGILGRGFLRSWVTGCLAVIIWYEAERTAGKPLFPTIRQETVGAGNQPKLRLLFISDVHLNWWNGLTPAAAVCAAARVIRPEVIVVGGDMIDARSHLEALRRMLRILSRIAPTHVISGNHDRCVPESDLRSCVEIAGAIWHSEAVVRLWVSHSEGYRIVCVHDPAQLETLENWDLGIAGHLHGGQACLWRTGDREYPGALISRWNGPRFDVSGRTVLISRGVADTLPLRWNCPQEVILCHICPEN
jgi:predicted MPP superfamily phosphohydrolase